eukprot:symbB.v1.2.012852.t2/scaffold875.1/size155714/1
MERRNEAEASLSNKVSRSVTATSESVETGHLRWPETPPAIVARRREQSAEAPERPSPRPAAGRSPSHPRAIGRQSVEEKAVVHSKKDFKKDKESLLKSVATLLQSGQSANVNSLDFYAVNVAVHKLTEELSAMKQCDRRRMTEAGSKKCFLQEVAIMKRLTGHANVIQLFEVVETPSQIVLVMEFATGGDLLKYVRNRRRLAEPCAKDLFKQLLEGLEHIHKKMVVHRDIKLENLLLDPFSCVKIADFGVAAVVQPEKKLHDHCGTPSYIAPEILQEEGYEGFPVDVWSSGIALYAMLCGRLPFKGKSMSELKRCILRGRYPCPEHLSTEAQQLIASMLTLEPRSRATVRSVLAHPFLQGLHSRAREIYGHLLCPKPLEDCGNWFSLFQFTDVSTLTLAMIARLLRFLALLKAIPTVMAFVAVRQKNLLLLQVAMVLLAVVNGPFDQVLQVFLVDNILPGQRTLLLSRKEMLSWTGTAVGPMVALLLVNLHAKTDWSIPLLQNVVCAGFVGYLFVEPAVLLLRNTHASIGNDVGTSTSLPDWTQELKCGMKKQWLVPVWTEIMWGGTQIAGSMSLKYVPLFFRKDFAMSPSWLMILRMAENLSLAAMNFATPTISAKMGRAWAAIIFILVGGILMLGVASAHQTFLAATLFILRTAIARANVPCVQSIIFESVLPKHRGRWTAITSFKSATNGAGAWVGGYLADRTGDYRAGFVLTASVQMICAVSYVPVAFMDGKVEGCADILRNDVTR